MKRKKILSIPQYADVFILPYNRTTISTYTNPLKYRRTRSLLDRRISSDRREGENTLSFKEEKRAEDRRMGVERRDKRLPV